MERSENVTTIALPPSIAQASIDAGTTLVRETNDGTQNRNPAGIGFWALIAEDFHTHERENLAQGFWVLFWHRFGNWRMSVKPKILRAPLSVAYRFGFKLSEWACGVSIPYSVPLGRRVKIEHFGGIIVAARAIGNEVRIRQNTTLGVCSIETIGDLPTIGDGVDIGVGVAILGDVVVGKKARVGANAVVLHDVPANTTVVGVPARPVQRIDTTNYAASAE